MPGVDPTGFGLGPRTGPAHHGPVLERFLDPRFPSLKICGVTRDEDAEDLAELGVEALGVNFWPKSKRYLDPSQAEFLTELKDRILRVGVFVNASTDLPRDFFDRGWIDVVQLHGDEPESDIALLQGHGIPVIRACPVKDPDDLDSIASIKAEALLLDAHAPGVYGGTGRTIDWQAVGRFTRGHPQTPVVLAGGIEPTNAAEALRSAQPAALDVASGAETSPGIKDLGKVELLLATVWNTVY